MKPASYSTVNTLGSPPSVQDFHISNHFQFRLQQILQLFALEVHRFSSSICYRIGGSPYALKVVLSSSQIPYSNLTLTTTTISKKQTVCTYNNNCATNISDKHPCCNLKSNLHNARTAKNRAHVCSTWHTSHKIIWLTRYWSLIIKLVNTESTNSNGKIWYTTESCLDEQCEGEFHSAHTVPALLCGHQTLWNDYENVYIARRTLTHQRRLSFRCEFSLPWWR
jgi:hypothetical protein